MAIVLIFYSMCSLNFRIKRKIVMRCYYKAHLQILEGFCRIFCTHFVSLSFAFSVANVHFGLTCCDRITFVLANAEEASMLVTTGSDHHMKISNITDIYKFKDQRLTYQLIHILSPPCQGETLYK